MQAVQQALQLLQAGAIDVDSGGHSDGGQTTWQDVAAAQARAQRAAERAGRDFPEVGFDLGEPLSEAAPLTDTPAPWAAEATSPNPDDAPLRRPEEDTP